MTDELIVGRTHGELTAARNNAEASVSFSAALGATGHKFEDRPEAVGANRTGKPPVRNIIPAAGASSLYSSTLYKRSRRT
jgi:hypothetical protein